MRKAQRIVCEDSGIRPLRRDQAPNTATVEEKHRFEREMSLMDDEGMEGEEGVVSIEEALKINKTLTQNKINHDHSHE